VLAIKLSLTGHSSATRQYQTSFCVVLYCFSYVGWGGSGKIVGIDAALAGESVSAAGCIRQRGYLLLSSGNWEHLSSTCC
jgi:hypothetical protein